MLMLLQCDKPPAAVELGRDSREPESHSHFSPLQITALLAERWEQGQATFHTRAELHGGQPTATPWHMQVR